MHIPVSRPCVSDLRLAGALLIVLAAVPSLPPRRYRSSLDTIYFEVCRRRRCRRRNRSRRRQQQLLMQSPQINILCCARRKYLMRFLQTSRIQYLFI